MAIESASVRRDTEQCKLDRTAGSIIVGEVQRSWSTVCEGGKVHSKRKRAKEKRCWPAHLD
jgi:hypothetical protein